MATTVATIAGTVVMLAITVAIIWYSASLEDRVKHTGKPCRCLDCRTKRGGDANGELAGALMSNRKSISRYVRRRFSLIRVCRSGTAVDGVRQHRCPLALVIVRHMLSEQP